MKPKELREQWNSVAVLTEVSPSHFDLRPTYESWLESLLSDSQKEVERLTKERDSAQVAFNVANEITKNIAHDADSLRRDLSEAYEAVNATWYEVYGIGWRCEHCKRVANYTSDIVHVDTCIVLTVQKARDGE
jgi:hypothetical protein